jgi:hypothetical protein
VQKEVEEAWGMEMWELIIDKKKELDERCPSGSYPVECLGTKDEVWVAFDGLVLVKSQPYY